jgi:hypothetical protein
MRRETPTSTVVHSHCASAIAAAGAYRVSRITHLGDVPLLQAVARSDGAAAHQRALSNEEKPQHRTRLAAPYCLVPNR